MVSHQAALNLPPPEAHALRYYQEDAYALAWPLLRDGLRVLLVLATGLGKTVLFSKLAQEWPGSVLVLAHRDELVRQAVDELALATGEAIGVEKADEKSWRERVVVGSVQSLCKDSRLNRLGAKRFSLIVVDEAHHAAAASYRKILDFFGCAVLGVTATPDRGDSLALGQVFTRAPYVLDIDDGIDQGWLVPVRGEEIHVREIDLSGIRASSTDLVEAQLDEAMLRAAEGVAVETLRRVEGRQAVIFSPGVNSSSFTVDRLNHFKPYSAGFICDRTPKQERRETIAKFRAGQLQFLGNCDIATEGFDVAGVSCIVQASPTLSRAKYAQRTGRGTRPIKGLLDGIAGRDQSAARRAAILASAKPDLLVLDFVGNSGRHSLVGVTDVLGGRFSEAEIALAKRKHQASPGMDQRMLLQQARRELSELAKRPAARVQSEVRGFDPFRVNGAAQELHKRTPGFEPPSEKQIAALRMWGFEDHELVGVSKSKASKMLDEQKARKAAGLASKKQLRVLESYGIRNPTMPRVKASEGLDYLAKAGWSRKRINPDDLLKIVGGGR